MGRSRNCCPTAGSQALDEREVGPACRLNAERRRWLRWPMHITKTTPCSQRRSLASAPTKIISTTFSMDAMVGRCLRQFKMPRPDAYRCPTAIGLRNALVQPSPPARPGKGRDELAPTVTSVIPAAISRPPIANPAGAASPSKRIATGTPTVAATAPSRLI